MLRQQRRSDPPCTRWCKRWLAWLGSEECGLSVQARFTVEVYLDEMNGLRTRIKEVKARLRAATEGDAVVEKLVAIKRIGEITAYTMRALVGRFDRFTSGKQLARFCAVTPRNASSGERTADSGMIRAGDPQLKSVVIEAAQRLRRYEPRWREMSEALSRRGKATSVIVGAVANRWLRSLYHQMKEIPMAA